MPFSQLGSVTRRTRRHDLEPGSRHQNVVKHARVCVFRVRVRVPCWCAWQCTFWSNSTLFRCCTTPPIRADAFRSEFGSYCSQACAPFLTTTTGGRMLTNSITLYLIHAAFGRVRCVHTKKCRLELYSLRPVSYLMHINTRIFWTRVMESRINGTEIDREREAFWSYFVFPGGAGAEFSAV